MSKNKKVAINIKLHKRLKKRASRMGISIKELASRYLLAEYKRTKK